MVHISCSMLLSSVTLERACSPMITWRRISLSFQSVMRFNEYLMWFQDSSKLWTTGMQRPISSLLGRGAGLANPGQITPSQACLRCKVC